MLHLRSIAWIGLLIVVVGLVAPATAAPMRNNIVNVDQFADEADLPPNLLSDEEIERINRLQNGAIGVRIISDISPDDGAVLIGTSNGLAFLEIKTGDTVPVDTSAFAFLTPLPALGLGEFSWQDERTIGTLALNAFATSNEDIFAVLAIDRYSGEIAASIIGVPDASIADGISSIAPNVTTWLILRAGNGTSGEFKPLTTRHTISFPLPVGDRLNDWHRWSAHIQRGVDRLHQQRPDLLNRLLWRQNDTNILEVTNTTTDLFLYDASLGDEQYITTIPSASSLLRATWTDDSAHVAVSFFGTADGRERPTFSVHSFRRDIPRCDR
jgi:hypothetical protein